MSTVVENINQAKSDLLGCKAAIIAKGVEIPSGTPTSDYAEKILSISSEYNAIISETHSVDTGGKLQEMIITLDDATLIIPETTYVIGSYAISGKDYFTDVVFGSSVHTIEKLAFASCSALKKINIPNSVIEIGNGAFQYCTALRIVTLPNAITSLPEHMLLGTAIKSIIIPQSVVSIGVEAFAECVDLTDIYYPGTQAEWEQITIGADAIPETATIHYEYTP